MTGMVQEPFGHTSVSRIAPVGPAQAYQTYGASMPLTTHWVPATCEEVDCEPYLNGWSINVAPLSEEQRAEINRHRYRYRVVEISAGEILWIFEPGQPCFRASTHRKDIGRMPVFYRRGGDWRGDPTRTPAQKFTRPEDWVDDMETHLARLRAAIEKG